MDFLDLVKQRYSVRGYTDAPVEEVLLNKVLQAGQQAPSAANRQPWHFVVVREKAKREAMLKAYAREWFSAAPVIIVVCVEPGSAWTRMDGKNYADVDGAIAMDHMTLCAASLGLGTCWIGAFNPDVVRTLLALPGGVEPLAMTPLGYPDAEAKRPGRKTLEEIIHYDRW